MASAVLHFPPSSSLFGSSAFVVWLLLTLLLKITAFSSEPDYSCALLSVNVAV